MGRPLAVAAHFFQHSPETKFIALVFGYGLSTRGEPWTAGVSVKPQHAAAAVLI